MSRNNSKYSPSFKHKAVELSYARGNIRKVSEELNVPYSVLCRWRKESRDLRKNSFPGKGIPKQTDAEKEIAALKRRLKDVELENAILKKAVSIFSTSDKKNMSL